MKKTDKKVKLTKETLKRAAEGYEDVVRVDYFGQTFLVRKTLPLENVLAMTEEVTASLFSESGEYMPEVREFSIFLRMLRYYTNIEQPEDGEELYRIFAQTNLARVISEQIDKTQFTEILKAIDERVNVILDSWGLAVRKQLSDAVAAIEDVTKAIASITPNISADELKTMARAIGENGFDEDKFAKALVEAQKAAEGKTAETDDGDESE